MCSHRDALISEKAQFCKNDPRVMADNSGSMFDEKKNCLLLEYCNYPYYISYPEGEVLEGPNPPVSGEETVLFLQYLNRAQPLPPRRKWLSFLELPGGELHNLPFQKEAVIPLAAKYGNNIDEFVTRNEGYGEPMKAGDAAFIIPVFPRLEMAVVIWGKDDEFPARANILFDVASAYHLPTASLYVLGIVVVKRLYQI